jgi:histone acetyltransferase (RNA polymerase elongator complex component)
MLLETFSATFEIGLQSNRSTILRKKKKGQTVNRILSMQST